MDILATVVTCCGLAQKCVQIINEVQAWPEELRRITRRITRLVPLLMGLMSHLQSQPAPSLAGLQLEQKNELENIIRDTKDYCKETHNILGECQSRKLRETGLEFRESWLGEISRSIYQKYGTMATDLRTLEDNLEKTCRDLNSYMGLLGIRQGRASHDALHEILEKIRVLELKKNERGSLERDNESLKRDNDSLKRDKARLMAKLRNASVHLTPTTTAPRGEPPKDGSLEIFQSVSTTLRQSTPESSPTRKDYKILFTDTRGDRSMMSELLVKILWAATLSRGGDWRVETVHSAGFTVKDNCDCVNELVGLNPQHKFHDPNPSGGGWPLSYTGGMALCDAMKHFIPQSCKAQIYHQVFNGQKSGLTRNMFRTYDFIVVFSWKSHDFLLVLRNALVTTPGQSDLGRGKGRIVHLGQYISFDAETKDIEEPARSEEGRAIRENWDLKALELNHAVQAFLAAELGWNQADAVSLAC